MERNIEVTKLLNVLRRMGRTARTNQWTTTDEAAEGHSVEQYNRILERLAELEPKVKGLFVPLPVGASWQALANATRELAAYYEDEAADPRFWADPKRGIWIDKTAFWGGDVGEFGGFIREKMNEWHEFHHRDKKAWEEFKKGKGE